MNTSKKRVLTEQVRRLRARFAQSVDRLLGDGISAEWLKQWVLEEVVQWRERLYGPLRTLVLFIEQMMSADHGCQKAVARGICARVVEGRAAGSANTGPYCKARSRLPIGLVERLGRAVGQRLVAGQPAAWRWRGREVKLVDGTTVSMPDTKANQARFPQNREQRAGLGFPLARLVAIVSLSCGAVLEWAVGPCEGKKTGETALLWELAKQLQLGDVVVADCCYAGYFMIAWLMRLGVDVVVRQHQCRATDFRRGQRLGARDHVGSWTRPKCPEWMDEVTYATMPQTLTLREARIGGWTLVTTLIDPHEVHKQELFALYRQRWQVAVSSQGHINQSVTVRPRLKDSGLVAWEVPWRESKTVEPSDNILEIEYRQSTRLQRAVNAEVASLHATPGAETVDDARRQQGLGEMSPMRQPRPSGYQRRQGTKEDVPTGEARGARRGKLVEEASPITVSGKWRRRRPGGGSGRSTVDRCAAKRTWREGPGPVSTPLVKVRQG